MPLHSAELKSRFHALDAFLLEKAMYELIYEMNNRPDWVSIPLAGIAEFLEDPT